MLTQKRLKELIHYDPETGIFTAKTNVNSRRKKGEVVGHVGSGGYIIIGINYVEYRAHRLAFLYMHGYLPESFVDHIDRDRANNVWLNLREVSQQCNLRNTANSKRNTSGCKGVSWHKNNSSWCATITVNFKSFRVGCSVDFIEAICHRLAAEQCLGWADCDSSSPAFQYIQRYLERRRKRNINY